ANMGAPQARREYPVTSHSTSPWKRVSRAAPCKICGKPDWCLAAADGTAAICTRVESQKRCGGAGWLHRHADQPPQSWRKTRTITNTSESADRNDLTQFALRCREAVNPVQLQVLASSLGLSVDSLSALGIGWGSAEGFTTMTTKCRGPGCWTFPMKEISG